MISAVSKTTISERLYKCKACPSANCTKQKCKFAHSIEELRSPECAFGETCHKKECGFKHPQETVENYRQRIGFVMPTFYPQVTLSTTETKKETQVKKLASCFVQTKIIQNEEDYEEDDVIVDIEIVKPVPFKKTDPYLPPLQLNLLSEELVFVFRKIAIEINRDYTLVAN